MLLCISTACTGSLHCEVDGPAEIGIISFNSIDLTQWYLCRCGIIINDTL